MGHADPLIAIPAGLFFGFGALWLAIAPEGVPPEHRWTRTLRKYLPEPTANAVLRISGLFTAAVCFWLVLHTLSVVVTG